MSRTVNGCRQWLSYSLNRSSTIFQKSAECPALAIIRNSEKSKSNTRTNKKKWFLFSCNLHTLLPANRKLIAYGGLVGCMRIAAPKKKNKSGFWSWIRFICAKWTNEQTFESETQSKSYNSTAGRKQRIISAGLVCSQCNTTTSSSPSLGHC